MCIISGVDNFIVEKKNPSKNKSAAHIFKILTSTSGTVKIIKKRSNSRYTMLKGMYKNALFKYTKILLLKEKN